LKNKTPGPEIPVRLAQKKKEILRLENYTLKEMIS
jgi:hypothetical protein